MGIKISMLSTNFNLKERWDSKRKARWGDVSLTSWIVLGVLRILLEKPSSFLIISSVVSTKANVKKTWFFANYTINDNRKYMHKVKDQKCWNDYILEADKDWQWQYNLWGKKTKKQGKGVNRLSKIWSKRWNGSMKTNLDDNVTKFPCLKILNLL